MPSAPLRPCAAQPCEALVSKGYCPEHERAKDQRRGTAASRGYDYKTWRIGIRDPHIRRHPLCGGKRDDAYQSSASQCQREGIVTAATDVHHIRGHNGQDDPLFRDPRNLESLCHPCHSGVVSQGDFGRTTVRR